MRAAVGVVVAFVLMMGLVLAVSLLPWRAFGSDTVLEPGRFDSKAWFDAYAVGVGVLAALAAGRLCAAIARSRRAVVVLAVLAFAGGMANVLQQRSKPEPGARLPGLTVWEAIERRKEAAWFTLLMPCLGAASILFAGRRAGRTPMMQQEYETVAAIRAAPETVWKVLTDPQGYGAWNPEIVALQGRLAPGEAIKARVRLGSGAIRSVPMRVTAFTPPTRMEWTGGLPFGLFVGRRTFTVTPREGGAEFRMHLLMTGPLAQMILKSVGDRQPDIDRFAEGLKQRAEGTAGS